MPGAQPKKDFLTRLASGLLRGSKAQAPGSGKVR